MPWRTIAGFRNVLTHGYLDIDLEVVRSVIEQDLPELALGSRVHEARETAIGLISRSRIARCLSSGCDRRDLYS